MTAAGVATAGTVMAVSLAPTADGCAPTASDTPVAAGGTHVLTMGVARATSEVTCVGKTNTDDVVVGMASALTDEASQVVVVSVRVWVTVTMDW